MDYAGLANKYGGRQTTSYAAMAAQYGGKAATPTNTDTEINKNSSAIGVAKGAGSTLTNLGKIGSSILDQTIGRVTNAIAGKGFTKPETNKTNQAAIENAVTPKNAAERAGFGAEQAAEFFIPGGAALDAGKAVEGVAKAANLGSKAVTAARIGATALAEGASTAAITAAQGGDAKQTAEAGLLGAGFSFGAEGLAQLGKYITSPAFTEGIVNKNLGISKNLVAQGRSPAKRLIEEGTVGTKQSLLNKATQDAAQVRSEVRSIIKEKPYQIESAAILNTIKQDLTNTFSAWKYSSSSVCYSLSSGSETRDFEAPLIAARAALVTPGIAFWPALSRAMAAAVAPGVDRSAFRAM